MSKVLKGIGKIAGPVASIAGLATGNPALMAIGQGIGLANSAFGSSPKDIPQTGQFTGGVNFRGLTTPTFSLQEGANSTYNLTRTGGASGLSAASLAQLQEILLNQQSLARRLGDNSQTFGQLALGTQGPNARFQSAIGGSVSELDRLSEAFGRLALGTQGPNARFQSSLGGAVGELNQLSAEATPGFGRLTDAAVKTIRDRRADAVGNLRESLAKRRLQGASFADSAIAEADLSFAQEEERARAEAITQEMAMRESLTKSKATLFGAMRDSDIDALMKSGELFGAQAEIEKSKAALFGAMRDSDIDALMNSAKLFAAQAGLDAQQAQVFTQQAATVKANLDAIMQAATTELQEFAVAGNIINRVQDIASNNARFDLANQFSAAQAQGSAQGEFFNFLGGSGGKEIISGVKGFFGDTSVPLPSNFSSSIGLFGRV